MEFLLALLGTWEGEGVASYPTIETFPYREHFVVRGRQDDDAVIYEQRTWTPGADGALSRPSHWETGFLIPQEDGSLLALTAHDPRTEVLRGGADRIDGGWRMTLESSSFSNDPRMTSDRRQLDLVGDTIRYGMDMATDRVGDLTVHLDGTLRRSADV